MGKLTKLKEDFKIENIKEAAKNALDKIGMGMIKTAAAATIALSLAGGFMGCNINPEIDYCEICEGIQDEYHVHEQPTPEPEQPTPEQPTPEQPTPEPEQPTPEQPEQPKPEPETEKCNQDGCVLDKHEEGAHDYCNEDNCVKNGKDDSTYPHTHDYCGDENCIGEDKTTNPDHSHDYCNEDNCVKNGKDDSTYPHTHNYCDDENCIGEDKTTNPDHDHTYPTQEPGYESWFQPATIGGSDLYQPFCIDNEAYNNSKNNTFTTEEKVNDYLDAYIDYINGLTLNENLTGNVENNLNNIKSYPITQKLNLLIGTTANDTGTIYSQINGINDICKPAIEKITQNISNSGDIIDKTLFKMYYKAISNEVYRLGYGADITTKKALDGSESKNSFEYTYIKAKADCSKYDGREQIPFENKYFYLENGELNPEVVQQFDKMITEAATKLQNQGNQVTADDLRNIIDLTFTTSGLEGIQDKLCPSLGIDPETCKNNEMVDVISNTDLVATTKLNKSIFSQNMGRELC